MTRNQKIALGCGGAGCLGLIVVVIASAAIYVLVYRQPARSVARNYNFNVNLNDNTSNSNSNTSDSDENSSSSNTNSNSNANSNTSTSAASMSDDDKHKLFQAASMTGDGELIRRVLVKMGLMNEDYTPGDKYSSFMGEHITWGMRNSAFIQTLNTPEKARAYVDDHFPE